MKHTVLASRGRLAAFYLAVLVLPLLLSFSARAAEVTATISGTVNDSTGAVVPKATVTLTNTGTNVSRTILTESSGSYLFTLVPIGSYRLTVEQTGFRKYIRDGIVLNVNQNAKLDIVLQVGAASQVVEVTGDVTQVDTVSATLGNVETERRILDLPLVERDAFQLGLLQAGVFPPDEDDGSNNPFSVSGQRSESLTFLVNGADNNDFLGNNAVVDPNPDALGEFKILTNNYEAEYGRTAGGIVNQVIKSGTNNFHGDVFEFFRNDALNARNYFLPAVTPFKRNTFGGTLGGPIKKDKTFFFLAYQGVRRHEGEVAPILQVLSPAERNGDFSELLPSTQLVDPISGNPYPNNQVPVNPVTAKYIAKYLPLPNLPNNNFVSSPVEVDREDQGIARIDHRIGQKDTIYGSYIIDDLAQNFPFQIINGASSGGNVPVGSGFTTFTRNQLGSISWLHNFSPTVINEFIFAVNRSATFQAVPHDNTPPSALGFTNVKSDDPAGTAPPIMLTTSFNLGPNPQGPTKIHDVTFHWQDSVSVTRGRHNMKFGADIRRVRNNFDFDFDNNGVFDFGNNQNFTGNPLADFVGGFFDNFSQFSRAVYGIRTTSWHFFGQDSWKVRNRLTLSYGLRYEYNTPLQDPHNEVQGFFPGQQSTRFPGAPKGILYAGDPGTPNPGLTFPDRNNFAPRFGFAWDMLGNAKLVMRGGFGIFYDIEDGALNLQFGGEAPFGSVVNITPSGYRKVKPGFDTISDPFKSFGLSNPFPTGGKLGSTFGVPAVSFAYVVDPHFRTPYSQNVNYGFQYQITQDTMIEADYVGTFSRKSIATQDVNAPLPSIMMQQLANSGGINGGGFTNPDCARPLAGCANPTDPNSSPTGALALYTDLSASSSSSNQFQLTVDKRFSLGFNIRGAYTLSKTLDNQSGFRYNNSVFTDPFNFAFDRGPANFDVRQRLVISGIWKLPLDRPFRNGNALLRKLTEGWEASGIASFQTGTPFTIYSNSNSSQENIFFDRADQIGPNHIFAARSLHSFDPSTANCLGGPVTDGHFYFDPTAYDCNNVPIFTFGNSPRNALRGPGRNNFDLTIGRIFKLTESKTIEFRSEFFNAFNHAQFFNPDHFGFDNNFGQITQARDPRIIQLALKFYF
ncbi:MAG TPA: carboxypeptidase regulatory-like domain-containing protein [Terriglobales bacterium]|nr:carboxypeptidase regulatory-like domain-containing protein [Terriglobales bacterium]